MIQTFAFLCAATFAGLSIFLALFCAGTVLLGMEMEARGWAGFSVFAGALSLISVGVWLLLKLPSLVKVMMETPA